MERTADEEIPERVFTAPLSLDVRGALSALDHDPLGKRSVPC